MLNYKNIFIVSVFAACFLLTIALFSIASDDTDLSGQYVTEDQILFTPDGGEPVPFVSSPDETTNLNGVYTSYYTIPAEEADREGYRSFTFIFGTGEAEITVDDEIIYSGELSPLDSMADTPKIAFSLTSDGTEKKIVAKVRYTDEDSYIIPAILMSEKPGAESHRIAALTTISAIPAGIAGLSFLIIVALFLMSLTVSPPPDYSLLFLAPGMLCFCVVSLIDTGALELPDFVLTVRHYVLPYIATALILIYIIWNRKKKILKYFLGISGVICVFILIAESLKNLFDHVPMAVLNLSQIAAFVAQNNFESAMIVASNYLIMICVAASLVYHIQNISEIATQKTMLESHALAVTAGYNRMVESLRDTTAVRHEWKHDLLTLSLLYDQGRIAEIGTYLQEKNRYIKENEWESFTGCFALDVILNYVSSKAKREGVDLETHVNVPPTLNVKEEDLCQLLLNMFDNAFHACEMVEGERFIRFNAALNNGFLVIRCSNSTPAASAGGSETEDLQHGYGINNMRKVCRSYGSDLVIDTETEGVYTVKTALQLNRTEG